MSLQTLLPSYQERYNKVKISNIIATHLSNSSYSIMPLIVFKILQSKSDKILDLQFINEKITGEYLEMLSLQIDKKVKGVYSLQIIRKIYEIFLHYNKPKYIFYISIVKVSENALRNLVEDKIKFSSRVCSNYTILYDLLS